MKVKAKELLEECEKEIKLNKWMFLLDSYKSEFKDIRKRFFEDIDIDEDELKIFEEICNNRLDRAKSFLGHTTTGLSILIGSLVVLAAILMGAGIKAESKYILLGTLISLGGHSLIFAVLLLIIAVFFLLLLAHYRIEVHAWCVFKEGALMKKAEAKARHR